MKPFAPTSSLALLPVLPDPAAMWLGAGIRPMVDGRDVLKEIHPEGDASCHRHRWFGPPETWPLWAGEEPRVVELSNNDCDSGCCGGVFVTIRRRGDVVEWSDWQNTSDMRVPVPPRVRFDAAEYDAELARLVADDSWEEPVDTAARLLAQWVAEFGWYERWACEPFANSISIGSRGDAPAVGWGFMMGGFGPGGAYGRYTMPVSDQEDVPAQVRRFTDQIADSDPRQTAKRL
ncbi:hypothetical protein [Streptomyces sp. NPDC048659]|uniref:hypothetical protein n=1 Tax=Streptomyces sp. NPDC048659 TaxID=3155489 RepID=UPI00343384BA